MSKIRVRKISEDEYLFEIDGEDHTIGSLLQHYLQEDEKVVTAYYSQPHPLEEKINVYIKVKSGADPIKVLRNALETIAREAGEFRELLLKAYEDAGINIED